MDSLEKPKILALLAQHSCTAIAARANLQLPCLDAYYPFCHRPHYSLWCYTQHMLPIWPYYRPLSLKPLVCTLGDYLCSSWPQSLLYVPLAALLVMPRGPIVRMGWRKMWTPHRSLQRQRKAAATF